MFKARYFPHSNLLRASRGGGSSFIWSGIWQAKEALAKGFRWVLGDGSDIDAHCDPWLRYKDGFCVEDTPTSGRIHTKVSEYFLANPKR